jgi:hypothetical protein
MQNKHGGKAKSTLRSWFEAISKELHVLKAISNEPLELSSLLEAISNELHELSAWFAVISNEPLELSSWFEAISIEMHELYLINCTS